MLRSGISGIRAGIPGITVLRSGIPGIRAGIIGFKARITGFRAGIRGIRIGIRPHLGLALEVEGEDELSPPGLTLPHQEDAVSSGAARQNQLGRPQPGQSAVEPGVIQQPHCGTHRPHSDPKSHRDPKSHSDPIGTPLICIGSH